MKVTRTYHMADGSMSPVSGRFIQMDAANEGEAAWKELRASADLIYLDPPLFADEAAPISQRLGPAGYSNGRERVKLANEKDAFSGTMEAYVAFMRAVLLRARECLKPTGCLYLHCASNVNAHLRLLMDEVFGADKFQNEIVWHYKSGGRARNFFARRHDTILFYRKSRKPFFDPEAAGEKRGMQKRNNLRRTVDETGRVYFSLVTAGKEYRYYEDETVLPGDVWLDISALQQRDPERTGHPTQKPLALLERIVQVSCPPDGLVMDFFSGSGTTALAAANTGRRFVAVDCAPLARQVLRRRLWEHGFDVETQGPSPQSRAQLSVCRHTSAQEMDVWVQGYAPDEQGAPYRGAEPVESQMTLRQSLAMTGEAGQTDGCPPNADLYMLDMVAAGRWKDGVFTVHDRVLRTLRHPALQPLLTIGPGPGTPCIQTVDCMGTATCFLIE
ncbi:MAG: site-specific DNA-methyltransferase [Clostridia bacterium]|nr:site-specific DNA-methyltransferase [Clostridia bacterium]MBQ9989287.1 site-specific DNA-methyltransferase [Clostridia bacterium]